MDDRFDKKLSSRITEVFDNYEHPTAGEGWAKLRKKFPVKKERNIAWLWWSSAAALLLVFLGVGIWLNNKPVAATNVTINPKKQLRRTDTGLNTQNIAGAKPETIIHLKVPADSVAKGVYENNIAGNSKLPDLKNNYVATGGKRANETGTYILPYGVSNSRKKINDPFAKVITALDSAVKTDGSNIDKRTVNSIPNNHTIAKVARPDTPQVAAGNLAGQQAAKVAFSVIVVGNISGTAAAIQPAKTIDDMFKQDKPQRKKENAGNTDLKKINFSVYAATYFNYAEGSSNQVNAGAGFTSDIRLSKNIRLSTGISLAQNTLSYASTPPAEAGRALAQASPAIRTVGFFTASAAVAEFQNYNASLVGLDIPLNIKYEFNPQKTDAYISAGLSSGTFIDERYTYRYAYKTNGLTDKTASTQDQTTTSSFNNFYFAKTLNVSFGVGYPIGKNRLVIEPFLKYPLSGLGTQDIRFGAGGVNLKFSFKTTKR